MAGKGLRKSYAPRLHKGPRHPPGAHTTARPVRPHPTVCIRHAYRMSARSPARIVHIARHPGTGWAGPAGRDRVGRDQAGGPRGRAPARPVTARSREGPSLGALPCCRCPPPPPSRVPSDRSSSSTTTPRSSGSCARTSSGRAIAVVAAADGPAALDAIETHRPGPGRPRPDAPRAGRARRHPRGPPRRRGGRDADHHPLGPRLDRRPDRRPRGRRRRLPAQALLPCRAGAPREVDPAPRRRRPTSPPRPARRCSTPTWSSTATASRSPATASRSR